MSSVEILPFTLLINVNVSNKTNLLNKNPPATAVAFGITINPTPVKGKVDDVDAVAMVTKVLTDFNRVGKTLTFQLFFDLVFSSSK